MKIPNKLYYGDNLTIMQNMGLHFVDLVYLDPPFNSKKDYNLLYRKLTGKPVPEQAEAFCDTWEMDSHKEEVAKAMPKLMREHGVDEYYARFWTLWIQALRQTQPHLLAYLIYMVQRLLYMKSILKTTGSIYLHCDPTASHYIKVMMDGIFGHNNFRSEIIWKRTSAHSGSKRWGPVHDIILFYTMSDKYTWNPQYLPYSEDYKEQFYRGEDDNGRFRLGDLTGAGTRAGESGLPWRGVDPTTSGRHWAVPNKILNVLFGDACNEWTVQQKLDALDEQKLIYWPPKGSVPQFKRYLNEELGVSIVDVITDINPIGAQARERLGYPTQKPIALLDRIIRSSSNEGDLVFDPFCGCGTTIYAAAQNARRWIGCDIAILSVRLIQDVLASKYHLVEGTHFEIDGVPVSVEQAQTLFAKDAFQFQHWLVERVGGFPGQRRGADTGIDGRLFIETNQGFKEVILSVKGGRLRPADVRDLRGVLEREPEAILAGFLCLQEPSAAMRQEAARAGVYHYGGVDYERIQLLTVREILEEKRGLNSPTKVRTRVHSEQESLKL